MLGPKIQEMLNKLLKNRDRITSAVRSSGEIYFKVGEYYFSVMKQRTAEGATQYMLFLYPKHDGSMAELLSKGEFVGESEFVKYTPGNADEQNLMSSFYAAMEQLTDDVTPIIDKILKDLH